MRTVLHLSATDVRRNWLLLAAVSFVHVLRIPWATYGPMLTAPPGVNATYFDGPGLLAMVVEMTLFGLTVATFVQADPPIGTRAFWRTRPIAPGALLASKLLTLTVALVAGPVALNALRLAIHDAPVESVSAASVQLALSRFAWIAAAGMVAAVTPSVTAFALAIAGGLLAATGVFVLGTIAALSRVRPYVPRLPVPDDSWLYSSLLVLAIGGVAVVTFQYIVRRTFVSIALIVAVLASAWVVTWRPMVQLARAESATLLLADRPVSLVDRRLRTGSTSRFGEGEVLGQVDAVVRVAGVAPGYSVSVIPRLTRLRGIGARIEGDGGPAGSDHIPEERLGRLVAATGLQTFPPIGGPQPPNPREVSPVTLLSAPVRELKAAAEQEVRIDSTLEIRSTRHRVAGTLNMTPGSTARPSDVSMFEIIHTRAEGPDWRILLRHTRFPTWRPRVLSFYQFAVQSPGDAHWTVALLATRNVSIWPAGFALGIWGEWNPFGTPWGSAWQTTDGLAVRPPAGADPRRWLRDARLVLLESTFAGHATVTWSGVDAFLPGAPTW